MTDPDESASDRDRRLDDLLGAYYEAVEAGEAVNPAAWAARHPEFAPELAEYFAAEERLHRMTRPLRAEEHAGRAGESPPRDPDPPNPRAAGVPGAEGRVRYFGDYDLLSEIDRGGMGVVFRARQRSLDRLVAVKMILPSRLPSDADLARFRNEARVVANLDHPGIVPIYEVGVYRGLSYFSMKLMEGGSLAQRLPAYAADPRSAARLVARVARAVDHAHRRGVLHRDLKPSNILLDADGAPHVGDFGLARRSEAGPGSEPGLTLTGELVGSPAYMAPEQATGRRGAATTAADVYGLGAVLYALLAGRPPFRGDTVVDTLEAVRRGDPEPPARANPAVPPDLQAICLKCLEKDPERRYPSAQALADDLDRYLAGEPTAARPPGPAARLRRWAGRHRRPLARAAAAALVVGLAALGALLSHRLERTQQEAQARAEDLRARDRLARHARYVEQIRLAAQLARAGEARKCEEVLDGLRPAGRGGEDLRGFEWHYLRGLLAQERHSWPAHGGGEVYHVTFSPDGKTLATCGADETARLWDAATLAPRAVLRGHKGDVNAVDFAPDGRTLATVGDDATLRFWAPDGSPLGDPLPALGTPTPRVDEPWAVDVAFDRSGRRVLTGGGDHKVRLWDPAARRELASVELYGRVGELTLTPDASQMVAAPSKVGPAWYRLRDPGDDPPAGRSPPAPWAERVILPDPKPYPWADEIYASVFSPDGRTLALSNHHNVDLWDVPTRRRRASLPGHLSPVTSLAFACDGRTLASGDDAGTVRLWDAAAPGALRALLGHRGRVWACAFSADGRTLATCSRDRTVKLWDVDARADRRELAGAGTPDGLAFRDAGTLLAAEKFGRVVAFDAHDGTARPVSEPLVSGLEAYECATSLAPGGRFVTTRSPGVLQVRALSDARRAVTLTGEAGCVFSPDGSLFATRSADGRVVLREGATMRPRGGPVGSRSALPVAVAPDGSVLVFEPDDPGGPTLARDDPVTGRRAQFRLPRGGGLLCHRNAFSPDGRWLAVAAEDASVVLLDGRTLERRGALRGHAAPVQALAFSPDGRTLATGGGDATVRLWHVDSAQEVLSLEPYPRGDACLAFSPDGRSLAVGGRPVVLWRAGDGPPDAPAP